MRTWSSRRAIRRAERRLLRRFFAVMLVVTLTFLGVVAVHRLVSWW